MLDNNKVHLISGLRKLSATELHHFIKHFLTNDTSQDVCECLFNTFKIRFEIVQREKIENQK